MTTFPGKGFSCDAPGLGATMSGGLFPSLSFFSSFEVQYLQLLLEFSAVFGFSLNNPNSHAASRTAARVTGHYTKFQSKDSHGMRAFDGVIHTYSFDLIGV